MIHFTIESLVRLLSAKIANESTKILLKEQLVRYVENTRDRFRFAKNLLFRNEPVDFYENYIPLTLKSSNGFTRLKDPIDIFREYTKVAVLGNAGSGKTTLLKFLTLRTIEANDKIPVYIELRLFGSSSLSFTEYVSSQITSDFSISVVELFKSDKFLFLFDGFDEINFSEGEKVISQIQDFISTFKDNEFIITSRPGTNIESLNDFYVYELAELNPNDIEIYVDHLISSRSQKELFYSSIHDNPYFERYLTTPLFLSIYIDYILKHDNRDVPRQKSIFFRNILDTLFSKHDSVSKLGFVRNKQSGLNRDELEKIVTLLAFRSILKSVNTFSKDLLIKELELIKRVQDLNFENEKVIYDLTIAINVLISINDYYTFPHILISEYLACLFIVRMPISQKDTFFEKIMMKDQILVTPSLLVFLFELDPQILISKYVIPKLESNDWQSYDRSSVQKVIEDFLSEQFKENLDYFSRLSLVSKLKKEFKISTDNDLDELFRL